MRVIDCCWIIFTIQSDKFRLRFLPRSSQLISEAYAISDSLLGLRVKPHGQCVAPLDKGGPSAGPVEGGAR